MTLEDILQDIYALEDEMRTYERKYGVLTETFYESYTRGEEPIDDAWVRDWTAWASAYRLWLRRRDQYQQLLHQRRTFSANLGNSISSSTHHPAAMSRQVKEQIKCLPINFSPS